MSSYGRQVRKGAGIIYSPTMVTSVYSVALGPVTRKDHFSRQNRPRDKKYKADERLFKGLSVDKKNDNFDYLMDENKSTIDLIA